MYSIKAKYYLKGIKDKNVIKLDFKASNSKIYKIKVV